MPHQQNKVAQGKGLIVPAGTEPTNILFSTKWNMFSDSFANVKLLKQGLQLEASPMMIYFNGVITDNIRQFIHLHKLDPDVLHLCPLQKDERQLESSLPILPSESLGSHPFFKFIDSLQRQNETMKKTPLLSLGKLSYQCYITKMISDISL